MTSNIGIEVKIFEVGTVGSADQDGNEWFARVEVSGVEFGVEHKLSVGFEVGNLGDFNDVDEVIEMADAIDASLRKSDSHAANVIGIGVTGIAS